MKIKWITEDCKFSKRDGKLVVERKQFFEVKGDPLEVIKQINIEDGITQEILNKALREAFR